MVNAEKMGRKIREVGVDANLLSLNFYVLLVLSSRLSVCLKLCVMNTFLHFLLCHSCRSLRNVSLCGPHIPFLRLIKRSYHGWLSMMRSTEDPLSALPHPPNPKSTTGHRLATSLSHSLNCHAGHSYITHNLVY